MRVLHVISGINPRTGGPATALLGLARAQVAGGMKVTVLATYADAADIAAAEAFKAAGVSIVMIGPTHGPFRRHSNLAQAMREAMANADVVHIHALWEEAQYQATVAARASRVPYLIRPCGMLDPWSLQQSQWKKRIYLMWRLRRMLNRAAVLHFTAAVERDLTQPLRLKSPAIVEPNGVDLTEFDDAPIPGSFRARYPRLVSKPLVLFLSRLHPKKGLELLLPAFAKASREAMLVIAGPDAEGYQAKLESLAATLNIGDRVLFTGMLNGREKIEALADADLFVLPSYQENFGNAVVESLAAGTSVVISDQVNIHAEISAAGVGSVVPTRVEELATELSRWLQNTELRDAAAGKAKAFVREHYDWKAIAARWGEHYRVIADRSNAGAFFIPLPVIRER